MATASMLLRAIRSSSAVAAPSAAVGRTVLRACGAAVSMAGAFAQPAPRASMSTIGTILDTNASARQYAEVFVSSAQSLSWDSRELQVCCDWEGGRCFPL